MPVDLIAVCPRCQETRYKSVRPLEPGKDKLQSADFTPVGDQPAAVDTEPAACYKCGSNLRFAPAPDRVIQGTERTIRPRPTTTPQAAPSNGVPPGVTVLFESQGGEEITEIKKYSEEAYLVITSRRILLVDVTPLLEKYHEQK